MRIYPCAVSARGELTNLIVRDRRLTVQRAIMEVDARGLEIEGIYRISGKLNAVQQAVQEIEQDEITFEFSPERHDVHTVSAVLRVGACSHAPVSVGCCQSSPD